MRRLIRTKRGQHIVEYALVVGLIAAAAIAMRTYVQRAVQASIKNVEDEAMKQPNDD